jgi:hypothetical protein
MLLAEGHLLYSGPAAEVVGWMGRFGLQVPFGTSIAGAGAARSLGGGLELTRAPKSPQPAR